MNCLYIDGSNSGISGDMFLASLLELVSNSEEILKELENLKEFLDGVADLKLSLRKMDSEGIQINQLNVQINEDKTYRTPKAMMTALKNFISEKPKFERCKEYALEALKIMIHAEAEVHGKKIDDIHLHELSSVDTLIDILGVAVCLNELGFFNNELKIYSSFLPLGSGFVKTAHGKLPVPAPATVKILEKSRITIFGGPIESELVTPTGAALLACLNPISVDILPKMILKKVSYSTGQKKFKNFINILRIFYGESRSVQEAEILGQFEPYLQDVAVIETNIDDVSGEILGHFLTSLERDKFLDVQIVPSLTKKNRPSHIIQLICHPKDTLFMVNKLINELGTLGVRYRLIKRICVDRKFKTLPLKVHNETLNIKFKIAYITVDNEIKILNVKPEYEDLNEISKRTGLTIKELMINCQALIKELYNPSNF